MKGDSWLLLVGDVCLVAAIVGVFVFCWWASA